MSTPVLHNPDIVERIVVLRKFLGMTQKQLGSFLGCSQQHILNIEKQRMGIPVYMIRMFTQNLRMFGLVVSEEWLLEGKGDSPLRDPNFNTKIEAISSLIKEDRLSLYLQHGLGMRRMYAEKCFFFVDDPSFLPWFDAGTLLMAEKRSAADYNPHWNGFYLYEHDGATFPAAVARKRKGGIFQVESLHPTQQKVVLFDVKLTHLYPIAGQLAFYNADQKTAGWLSRLIQNDTE